MGRRMQPIRNLDIIEEFKELLKQWELRNWLLFCVGISTGLRISDILPLRLKDVSGTYIELTEKKTKKYRKIIINKRLRSYFDHYLSEYDWLGPDDFLFKSQMGNFPISEVQAWRIMKKIAKQMGLDSIGTHTMRKSFGYHLYQRTKDIALVQEILNHSSSRITMIYIGLVQENIDRAIMDFEI